MLNLSYFHAQSAANLYGDGVPVPEVLCAGTWAILLHDEQFGLMDSHTSNLPNMVNDITIVLISLV